MTFTKEWLQKAISDIETMRDEIPFGLDEDGNNTLSALKLALAGMEAELERGKIRRFELDMSDCDSCGQDCGADMIEYLDGDYVLWEEVLPHLYQHADYDKPQPLTTSERAELENYRNAQQVVPSDGRDQFEEWFKFHHGDEHSIAMLQRANGGANYIDPYVDLAWISWKDSRAAMLQAGNHTEQHLDMVDHSGDANEKGNSPVIPGCWCRTCRPVKMNDMRFVVCPDCGNKRCPHANDHRNACTGSNEPGQEGSAYPAAPQQETE